MARTYKVMARAYTDQIVTDLHGTTRNKKVLHSSGDLRNPISTHPEREERLVSARLPYAGRRFGNRVRAAALGPFKGQAPRIVNTAAFIVTSAGLESAHHT